MGSAGSASVASATSPVKGVVGLGEGAQREGGGEGIEEGGRRVLAEIDERCERGKTAGGRGVRYAEAPQAAV